ncbi:MAG: hypothetical protein HYZ73_01095 [Elusimicrobia bacterium]|nr:hypothetical protein [Elusimicrobiota bacterium]
MARRRLIDPSMWQSGHFKRLNLRQRLLWTGVITLADDEGKLKGESAVLRAGIFPFDEEVSGKMVEQDLQTLQKEGLIERYTVAGDLYIRLVKWAKYQKPSHPAPSKIPDPPPVKNSGETLEPLPSRSGGPPDQSSLEKERSGLEKRRAGEVPGEPRPKSALNGNEEPGWLIPNKLRSSAFYFQQRQCEALKRPTPKLIDWLRDSVRLDEKQIQDLLASEYHG